MSDLLRFRVIEWPLYGDDMTVAIAIARVADDQTRATKPLAMEVLAFALEMPFKRLALALSRLQRIGAIDRLMVGKDAVLILAPVLPQPSRRRKARQ